MTTPRYYEDFEIGEQFTSHTDYVMNKEEAIWFAEHFDPQDQHICEEKAKQTTPGTLIASGWHTGAATMRLKLQTPLADASGGLLGLGLDYVKWPRAVYPGDSLHLRITVMEKRPSNSQSGKGLIKYKTETFNQKDELVMEMIITVIMPMRGA